MSDIKSPVVLLHKRVKVQARKNELVCQQCGSMIFWLILRKGSIRAQCTTCYEFFSVNVTKKSMEKLSSGKKQYLLTAGRVRDEKITFKRNDVTQNEDK